MEPVPLSVLDLATVSNNGTSAQALSEATHLALKAEELGYARFWVAEHHNMNTVASTSPAVLIAHVAASTKRIKVGSGGVMLPNHAPLVIAEQFALLEALHPGRIDLGIGRAPGSDRQTMAVIRGSASALAVEDFPRDLIDVMGLLGDVRTDHGLWNKFSATPVATTSPAVVLLGSSGFSAQLAGVLGLPFTFANHFDTGGTLEAVELYREAFRPSPVLSEPYTIVSASVMAATTTDEAQMLAAPSKLRKYGMRTGRFWPLVPPDEALSHPEWDRAEAMPSNAISGTSDEVVTGLQDLAAQTEANELFLHCSSYAIDERITSLELIAESWSLEPHRNLDTNPVLQ
ncbi:MAG: LLM class flavin-dependent oxidoreductase [Actinomycetota bacterium]|nr:LLM class flavin-dependent oxidoreductase [Actinomycetota bacterium]